MCPRLSLAAARHLDAQPPALLVRKVGECKLVLELMGELEAEMTMHWLPYQQAHDLGEQDVMSAKIVRGERMWELLELLGL